MDDPRLPLEHPANAGVLRYLRGLEWANERVAADLPESCSWVVHGIPVLGHPHTGVIFGFSTGMDYALRLPPPALALGVEAGVKQVKHSRGTPSIGIAPWTFDLREIGPDWRFGAYRAEERQWCTAAFHAAASGWPSPA